MKKLIFSLFTAFIATTALWASTVITYKATAKLTGYYLEVGKYTFGPKIITHTFANGTGTITCNGDITTIGERAFWESNDLTSVNIPNSVKTIGESAFFGCEGLTSIIIPNSVTTIGEEAFSCCSGLTSLTIGSSVTTIGEEAFYYCSGLTSVTIPKSVTTIGESAFSCCYGLTAINVAVFNTHFSSIDGVLFNYAKNTLIQYPMGKTATAYTIPNSVTTIGGWAFHGCVLTSVTIPKSVTTMGENAFYYCTLLTAFNVDVSNTHFCAIDGVLYDYAKNTLIQYPMGKTATAYTIPNSVITIGDYAFDDCRLTSITIGSSVTTIGDYAFSGCSGLTSIMLPNSIKTIGDGVFTRCSGLTSVTIPNSVIKIGDYTFVGCSGLTSMAIGNSVTTIGDCAFAWCEKLSSITCYAVTPPTCGDDVFDYISQNAKAYVPAAALTDYQNAEVWKDMQLYPIAAEVTPMDDENPIVTPTDQDVTITWPITDGTDTYTLTITAGGKVFCVMTFNAEGQMINIAFKAPAADGAHQAPAATLTAQGYQFTVTGLNPGTAYDYSVTATDAGGKTLAEHKGNFSTTGGTGLESVHDARCTMHKVLRDGQLLIETNNATYTPMGQKVR